MTTRQHFRAVMAQRRPYRNDPRWRIEWQYLSRAARKLVWIMNGIGSQRWPE